MIHAPNRGFEKWAGDVLRRLRALERNQTGISGTGSSVTIIEQGGGDSGSGGAVVVEGPAAPSSPAPGTIWIKTT